MKIWKPAKGLEGYIEVSSDGEVKSLFRGRILKQTECMGYMYVMINAAKIGYRKNRSVHRLIAEAFLPEVDGKKEVNHIDMDKKNNHISNLEWCTHSENCTHAHRMKRKAKGQHVIPMSLYKL